jgi:protein SCO1/2
MAVNPTEKTSDGLQAWPESSATPEFKLHDTNGKLRTGSQFHGDVLLVLFGFTHCPSVCPTELSVLTTALKKLGPSAASQVKLVFITLDPENDSAEDLKVFLGKFDKHFIGLRGTPDEINNVAQRFFVQHARVATSSDDYTVDHSEGVFIFDAQGKLRFVGPVEKLTEDFLQKVSSLVVAAAAKKH